MDAVLDIKETVGELKGTSEATLVEVRRTNGRVTDHDVRLAAVERVLAIEEHDETARRWRLTRLEVWIGLAIAVGVGLLEAHGVHIA